MEAAPSSFSGPPLSLPRVPAYDHGDLLPQREAECAAHKEASPPPVKPRTRPHSRHEQLPTDRETTPLQAGSTPTPPSPWGEEKQQAGGASGGGVALAPWSHAAVNLFLNQGSPSSHHAAGNYTPRLSLSPTSPQSGGPRTAAGGRGARSAGGEQHRAPVRRPGASSPRRQPQFSVSSPTSPASPHRALLALQANLSLQSSTIDRHSPFGRSYNSFESEWPADSPSRSSNTSPSATTQQPDSLSRVDAMIRQRMDQTARIRSGTHLAILDSLYTNASGAFNPQPPAAAASSPNEQRRRELTRERFDPSAKWERVRKVHAAAAAKEAASRAAILERSDERRREAAELARANAEVERRNREERAKTHDLYERLKAERVARKAQEKEQAEAAEKEAVEQRKREHAKLADFIRAHAESLASAGFKDRETREREQAEATERLRKRDADRWAAHQQQWKLEGEEARRAREEKDAKERAAREEAATTRREHAARARKELDSRIAAKIVALADTATKAREAAEANAAREETQARRQREAYARTRDALAEEARKKAVERQAAREDQTAREIEERVARQRALYLLASKNLRATIRANSPPSSPKRQHSPRRSQSPVGGNTTPPSQPAMTDQELDAAIAAMS